MGGKGGQGWPERIERGRDHNPLETKEDRKETATKREEKAEQVVRQVHTNTEVRKRPLQSRKDRVRSRPIEPWKNRESRKQRSYCCGTDAVRNPIACRQARKRVLQKCKTTVAFCKVGCEGVYNLLNAMGQFVRGARFEFRLNFFLTCQIWRPLLLRLTFRVQTISDNRRQMAFEAWRSSGPSFATPPPSNYIYQFVSAVGSCFRHPNISSSLTRPKRM
jgi:hypothetical protein